MRIFRDVSCWRVDDEIKKGNTVIATDKENEECFVVNVMSAEAFFNLMTECEKGSTNRYNFWVREEVEEVKEAEGKDE